jgi:hypothetical protein
MQPLPNEEDQASDAAPLRYRETRCHPSMLQNSIFRTAAYIGMLIAGWWVPSHQCSCARQRRWWWSLAPEVDALFASRARYVLSTGLSLYNKKLVGKNYGIFGKGSFPGGRTSSPAPARHKPGRCTSAKKIAAACAPAAADRAPLDRAPQRRCSCPACSSCSRTS